MELGHQVKKYAKFLNRHNSVKSKLQVLSIAQNVGSAIGLPVDITYFRWQFWRKSSPRPQNFVRLQTFYLFNIAPIRYQKWKDHVQIMREK